MLIECKIKRDGPTIVSVEKMDYVFTSRPHLTGGDEIAQTCEVISSSHSAYFLRIPGGLYIQYEKKGAPVKAIEKKAPPTELTLESFFLLKNVAQVKSTIKKCDDTLLLNKIGAEESEMKTRRQWVIEALEARLVELEG
jgi:hypothetical protein